MYRRALRNTFALLCIAAASVQAQSAEEQVILRLENDLNAAWQKRDSSFLQALYAEDYVAIHASGNTYTKAQDLAILPNYNVTSHVLSDMKVRVYGDVAVVTALGTLKGTYKERDISGAARFTDVFVKRDGRWRLVLTQGTSVVAR